MAQPILSRSVLIFLFATGAMFGQDSTGTAAESWFQWQDATGDWGGVRTSWEDRGISPALNFTTDLLANPEGGIEQGSAIAYLLYGSLTFDLEKLADLPGLSFYVAASLAGGEDLSAEDIGNFFGVAQAFNGDGARLAEVYVTQMLAEDRVEIMIGRFSTGHEFVRVDAFQNYVSGAVNGNPGGIKENFTSFTTSPFVQWGARVKVAPSDLFYVAAGVFNADPDAKDDSNNGFDFSFDPDEGVLSVLEAGLTPNQVAGSRGLPGRYVVGGVFDSSEYETLTNRNRTKSGNHAFYLMGEQMVYRAPLPGDPRGLSLWGAVTVAPDEEINTLPLGLYGGAYYTGLFRTRRDDVTAAAVYYGAFSDDLPGQTSETVLELNHRFQIAPSTYVTPDFQYIFNPNGGGIPDAWVIGLEASIDF
ncbi:MAG: carbohydrate porin [Pseudomonadota bacterium]